MPYESEKAENIELKRLQKYILTVAKATVTGLGMVSIPEQYATPFAQYYDNTLKIPYHYYSFVVILLDSNYIPYEVIAKKSTNGPFAQTSVIRIISDYKYNDPYRFANGTILVQTKLDAYLAQRLLERNGEHGLKERPIYLSIVDDFCKDLYGHPEVHSINKIKGPDGRTSSVEITSKLYPNKPLWILYSNRWSNTFKIYHSRLGENRHPIRVADHANKTMRKRIIHKTMEIAKSPKRSYNVNHLVTDVVHAAQAIKQGFGTHDFMYDTLSYDRSPIYVAYDEISLPARYMGHIGRELFKLDIRFNLIDRPGMAFIKDPISTIKIDHPFSNPLAQTDKCAWLYHSSDQYISSLVLKRRDEQFVDEKMIKYMDNILEAIRSHEQVDEIQSESIDGSTYHSVYIRNHDNEKVATWKFVKLTNNSLVMVYHTMYDKDYVRLTTAHNSLVSETRLNDN